MKRTVLILITASIFAACNNDKNENDSAALPAISPESEMKAAIAKYPDSLLLKENLIQYYRDSGNYKQAIEATDIAIKKDSSNARLWDIKATLHFENEDTLAAIQAFEKAVDILPDPQYMISLGVLYAETKNAKAVKLADLLLQGKYPAAAKEALFIKGLYFNYSGDKLKAIPFFDQCLAMDYSFMDAYREKAVALYELGKYDDALKVLGKATTLQNGFDEGYYWMGRCYEKLNRRDDAADSYRQAIRAATSNNDDNLDARDALEKLGLK